MEHEFALRKADEVVDVTGESCPIPEMAASKRLREMKPGGLLEVLTDHAPAAEVTLPALSRNFGFPLLVVREGDLYRVKILKVK